MWASCYQLPIQLVNHILGIIQVYWRHAIFEADGLYVPFFHLSHRGFCAQKCQQLVSIVGLPWPLPWICAQRQ